MTTGRVDFLPSVVVCL